jgi:hypothetical protein
MTDVDDGSIADDANLLRRIRPEQIVDDNNTGTRRPSSAAFKDSTMSVDAEPLLIANGLDWTFTLAGYQGFSLAQLLARETRLKGQAVVHKPLSDNPAHTEVVGKKTQGTANYFVSVATWVHLEPKAVTTS